ncbi:MAG: M56 family metallopeptidase, partial [Allomuricauda sp.]
MLIYILKSSACLSIFFLFYKLFLEKVSFHIFKRFYLIVALVLSLIIPLLVFKEYVTRPMAPELENFHFSTSGKIPEIKPPPGTTFDFKTLMLSIYGLGLLLFSLRFFWNLAQMVSRIRNNPKLKFPHCTQVLLQEKMPPHTFFRFIFLNKHKLENKKIPHEVLVHEETHVAQRHSWDVMFIELLQIAFWFNPLIVFFKRAIKLNHEFLADQAALIQTEDVACYQNILLEFAAPINSKPNQPALSNAIHYSSIKKRLT